MSQLKVNQISVSPGGTTTTVDNLTATTATISAGTVAAGVTLSARAAANGIASLDSSSKIPANQLRSPFTSETVADAAARNALTVLTAEIFVRTVKLADTGVIYFPNAAGTGSGIWEVFNSVGTASTSGEGVVELATATEARDVQSASTTLVPSVSSMQAAIAPLRNGLAPRQGLVFDGTAGATVVNLAAKGSGAFSVALWVTPSALSGTQWLIGGAASSFGLALSNANVYAVKRDVAAIAVSTGALVAGKPSLVVYTRTGTTGTYYIDGVAAGTATDANDYTVASSYLGRSYDAGSIFTGVISLLYPYNRALSAAEVLALYESGAPAAADYNNASNTSVVTGDDSTFASVSGNWGLDTGNSISGGKLNLVDGKYAVLNTALLTKGRKYRATLTIDSLTAGIVSIYDGVGYTVVVGTGAGTVTVEWTQAADYSLALHTDGGNGVVDNLTLYHLGLLCAPESNAPGNGYQWHDMSGNMADITLPTSGVAWALPDRRPNSVRGTLTWAGTHEAKSLLGQRALPNEAVVTLLTRKATAGSSGSGCTVGTTNSATRWQALDTFTTAKEVATLANQLPAGTADADTDVLVDPDTANFTGSIEVEAHYVLTQ